MSATNEHVERIREAITTGEAVRSIHTASWARCVMVHDLDPARFSPKRHLNGSEFASIVERSEELLATGTHAVDRLQVSAGPGVCLLWADANGIAVRSWVNDADKDDLYNWGLSPGFDWSEETQGTNGIGTCLVERHALVVRGDQHFFQNDQDITCLVAPIFDHVGSLRGVLNATAYGREQTSTSLLFAAVCSTADSIETELFHHAFRDARVLSLGGRRGSTLVAVDDDNILVGANRAARVALKISDAEIKGGCYVPDFLDDAKDGFALAERGVLRRALARADGNVTAAAASLDVSRATMKRKMSQHRLSRRN